jgi:hypothetical protein
MPKERKTILYRQNGVANAFMREYGCRNCPQCSVKKPRVHTSGSLIIKSDWESHRKEEYHLLFDCGAGVIDSLMDFGAPFVTHIFFTHNHWDHIAEIDPLVNTQARSGGPENPPVYCTQKTWETGPNGRFPWLGLNHQSIHPYEPIELDLGIGLKVTPVPIYHGPTAFEPVHYVVEFADPDTQEKRKIIIAWDLLHHIPRYPLEDRDNHFKGEETVETAFLPQHKDLLTGADALFIEGNTLTPQPDTGHTSIQTLLKFHIPQYAAKRNFIVHYSGHEDPGGPMSDESIQDWVDLHKGEYGLADAEIKMMPHGLLLTF